MLSQGVCGTRHREGGAGERDAGHELQKSRGLGEGLQGVQLSDSVHTRPRVHPQNHANSTKHNHLGWMVGDKEECQGRKEKEKQKVTRKSRIMKRMLASSALCLRLRYITKFPKFTVLLLLGFCLLCFTEMRSCCISLVSLKLMAILLFPHSECTTIPRFQVRRVVTIWFCLLGQGPA